jgi:hypothetical protein
VSASSETRTGGGPVKSEAPEGEVEADLARQPHSAPLGWQLPSRRGGIHPGEVQSRRHAVAGRQAPQQGEVVGFVALGGVLSVVNHHEDQEALQKFGRVGGQARQGGEEVLAFGKGRDYHGAGEVVAAASLDLPGPGGTGAEAFMD